MSERRPLGRTEEPPPGSVVIIYEPDDSQVWYRTRHGGTWWATGSGLTWGVTWEYLLDMLAEPDNTGHGPYLLVDADGSAS